MTGQVRSRGRAAAWGVVALWALWAAPAAADEWVDTGALAEGIPPGTPQPHRIELHTMGNGDTIFSHFGHSALCVVDDEVPVGLCYNYGTAEFDDPVTLTWEVLRGRAPFWVSKQSRRLMLHVYKKQDRTEYVQVLPLTDEEELRLSALLRHDAKPENKDYIYNHFFDNCATRLRDHIDTATRGRLSAGAREELLEVEFRDYVRQGFASAPALLVWSEVMIGRSVDRRVTLWEAMFLPRVIRREVTERFGVEPEVLYTRQKPPQEHDPMRGQQILMGLALLALALMLTTSLASSPLATTRQRRLRRAGLVIAGLTLGGLALLMDLLAVLSLLPELRYNEAMLVFLPTDLLLLGLDGPRLRRYLQVRAVWLIGIAGLAATGALVQPLAAPLALAVGFIAPLWWAERRRENLPKPRDGSTSGEATTLDAASP